MCAVDDSRPGEPAPSAAGPEREGGGPSAPLDARLSPAGELLVEMLDREGAADDRLLERFCSLHPREAPRLRRLFRIVQLLDEEEPRRPPAPASGAD